MPPCGGTPSESPAILVCSCPNSISCGVLTDFSDRLPERLTYWPFSWPWSFLREGRVTVLNTGLEGSLPDALDQTDLEVEWRAKSERDGMQETMTPTHISTKLGGWVRRGGV